jgi:hypothetical protein
VSCPSSSTHTPDSKTGAGSVVEVPLASPEAKAVTDKEHSMTTDKRIAKNFFIDVCSFPVMLIVYHL